MKNPNALNEAFSIMNKMNSAHKSLNEDYIHWKKGDLIKDDMDQIRIEGRVGKWYVFDSTERGGKKYFILEHETYGDEAGWIVVDEQGNEIIETWDDIETALDDAEITECISEEAECDECDKINEYIDDSNTLDERALGNFSYNGTNYNVIGKSSNNGRNTVETVWVVDEGGQNVAKGRDRWLNRPWYKFKFANALSNALIDFFGKDYTNTIADAINDSSNCAQACNIVASNVNKSM